MEIPKPVPVGRAATCDCGRVCEAAGVVDAAPEPEADDDAVGDAVVEEVDAAVELE